MRMFCSTARIVSQQGLPIEVEGAPGVYISPGNEAPTIHAPTILEITIPTETSDDTGNDRLINSNL